MNDVNLGGRLVDIGDTALYVVERGNPDGFPLLVVHGGPALDHTMFGDYLDPLGDDHRLLFVDQRAQGRSADAPVETWTLEHHAADLVALGKALGLERYATLGHSYGAMVVLQNAVDHPDASAATIVSSGVPAARFLAAVETNLARFEPESLREQVAASWEREKSCRTHEEAAQILSDQLPFHFADPVDARIAEYEDRTRNGRYNPDLLRHFATAEYGGIDVEGRLAEATHPVLVLAGRFDRVCTAEAAEVIAAGLPNARLVVFEESAHMTFVEENARYLESVRTFLSEVAAG